MPKFLESQDLSPSLSLGICRIPKSESIGVGRSCRACCERIGLASSCPPPESRRTGKNASFLDAVSFLRTSDITSSRIDRNSPVNYEFRHGHVESCGCNEAVGGDGRKWKEEFLDPFPFDIQWITPGIKAGLLGKLYRNSL